MCFNLIDSIRYGLMGSLQFHEMACMDSAPCSPSAQIQVVTSSSMELHDLNVHLRRTLHGKKFLSIEPQQVRWTGLLTISEQMEQVSFLVTQVLRNCGFGSSSSRGGGVIDFMYWITALGVSPLLSSSMFGCFEIMPSTLGELLKCEQIYKIIYARTFFAVIIFAKSG